MRKAQWKLTVVAAVCLTAGLAVSQTGAQTAAKPEQPVLDRTVLPVPEPQYPPITELDARKAKAPPRFEVKAPQGAPNVVIVLIDDIGFGHASTFGGPIHMPSLEREWRDSWRRTSWFTCRGTLSFEV